MQNAKTFHLNKKLKATVHELTVAQALEIFWLIGDYAYPSEFETFLQAHAADALSKARELVTLTPDVSFNKLKPDEQQALIGHFVSVNAAFFGSSETSAYYDETDDLTGFAHYENLVEVVNALIRLRHADVLNYPISFMNEVVAQIGQADNE